MLFGKHLLVKFKYVLFGALASAALFVIACGAAATATPRPTLSPTPGDTAVAPTAIPKAVATVVGEPEVAPAFSEYWKPPTEYYGAVVSGGTLRVNYEDPLDHANTWGAFTGTSSNLRELVHNNIVEENPYQDGEIIPDLARGWTFHEDGLGITFFFHPGIKWHNGEAFTCEDARFSLEVMATGQGVTTSEMRGKLGILDLQNTKCLDDLRLSLRQKAPSATVLLAVGERGALIFNKKWFQQGGEDAMFNDLSVGTGPFKWAPGQNVGIDEQRFVKNPDYFKPGLPYLDELILFGIVDESAQLAAQLAHKTDLHWVRNFGQYDAYVNHDRIMTVIRATRGHHSIWLNKNHPPFDNVKVRQAIFMGIDRDAAIKVLQAGHGSSGFMMAPGSAWELGEAKGCAIPGWCSPPNMEQQRSEAKAILKAQGFDFSKTFRFTVESDEQVIARATFIQEQLRLLGVTTEFDLVETVAYRKQTNEGTWGDILPRNDTMPSDDPALGMGHYFRCKSANNHWRPPEICDPKMEDLLDKAVATIDPAQRKAISDQIQLYAMEQYWKFPLYWEQEAVAFWPEVRGYFLHPNPTGSWRRFEQVWIDPAHKNDKGNKGQTSGPPGGI